MDPVIQNLNLITMIFQRAAILASIGVKQAGHGGYSNGTFNTMELRMPDGMELYLEIRGTGSWCVALAGGLVMHSTGQWVYERSPSNRTPGFLHHTRYSTPQEALDALNRMLPALEGR